MRELITEIQPNLTAARVTCQGGLVGLPPRSRNADAAADLHNRFSRFRLACCSVRSAFNVLYLPTEDTAGLADHHSCHFDYLLSYLPQLTGNAVICGLLSGDMQRNVRIHSIGIASTKRFEPTIPDGIQKLVRRRWIVTRTTCL